ncbi:hypothetical protein, partial [Citrobacter braakii]|uniref:hypothetical protein n=1 Tax=Citrobacter braakii TaxID=57706 RepID=UPI003976C6F0
IFSVLTENIQSLRSILPDIPISSGKNNPGWYPFSVPAWSGAGTVIHSGMREQFQSLLGRKVVCNRV